MQLETDAAILVPKARQALDRYGHQVVIGNLLATRKHEVVFVEPREDGETWLRFDSATRQEKQRHGETGREIEEDIVDRLVDMHSSWITRA